MTDDATVRPGVGRRGGEQAGPEAGSVDSPSSPGQRPDLELGGGGTPCLLSPGVPLGGNNSI